MNDQNRGVEAGAQSWLSELERIVRSGNSRSQRALAELSTLALGGYHDAQLIVDRLDNDISSRKLILPPEADGVEQSYSNLLSNVIFALMHPIETVRAKARQVMVSVGYEDPPFTSTIEDFPDLSLRDAASAIRAVQPRKKSLGFLPPDKDPGDF